MLVPLAIMACASLAVAQEEDALTIDLNAPLESLDVQTVIALKVVEARVFGIVSDILGHADADCELVPMLATGWSDDGETWTFESHDDPIFHDGTRMTADDVACGPTSPAMGEA